MIQHYDEVYHFTLRRTVALGVDPARGQPSNYPMMSENMNNLNDGNYLQTSSNTYARCRLLHIPANSKIQSITEYFTLNDLQNVSQISKFLKNEITSY